MRSCSYFVERSAWRTIQCPRKSMGVNQLVLENATPWSLCMFGSRSIELRHASQPPAPRRRSTTLHILFSRITHIEVWLRVYRACANVNSYCRVRRRLERAVSFIRATSGMHTKLGIIPNMAPSPRTVTVAHTSGKRLRNIEMNDHSP